MKRSIFILVAGIALAFAAWAGCYFGATAHDRAIMHSATPELAWLKQEFNLSDQEFARISKLHEAYLPDCARMCKKIADKNSEIKTLLTQTNVLTPEIGQRLAEAAQLRLECQKHMLEHFLAVSRSMPPQEGKRYLEWVQERTFLPDHGMPNHSTAGHETNSPMHHH